MDAPAKMPGAATRAATTTHMPVASYFPNSISSHSFSLSAVSSDYKDGSIKVTRQKGGNELEYDLNYRIHNPMRLSSQQAAPLLVLHGGPGIPSDYLYPLSEVVPYRSIIFFDQLGCGRSPVNDDSSDAEDADPDIFSIDLSLDDLEFLIHKLGLRQFHLYGQSFGGILAFEYLKRISEGKSNYDDSKCLSVILSSTPTNVSQVETTASQLISSLKDEDDDESTLTERFRVEYQCRTLEKPKPLLDAYNHAGTVWRGTDSISDWEAVQPAADAARMPSAMVLRGEHDFVTEDCVEEWKSHFNHNFVRFKVLQGCSHHGLLENGNIYGDLVDSFLSEYD